MRYVLLLLLIAASALDAYTPLGWQRLAEPKHEGKYSIQSDGFATYTMLNLDRHFAFRHSYAWFNVNGSANIAGNYWLNGLLQLQKMSFSNSFTWERFTPDFYPNISFVGAPADAVFEQPVTDSRLSVQVGVIPEATHAHGLLYSQFTAGGMHVLWESHYLTFEGHQLGTAYDSGGDVGSYSFYTPYRWFGVSLLHEYRGSRGERLVPGVSSEVQPHRSLRLYLEGAYSYVYRTRSPELSEFDFFRAGYSEEDTEIIAAFLSGNEVKRAARFDEDSVAGLFGFSWQLELPSFFGLKLSFVQEGRYYGHEHSSFYLAESYTNFDYQYDLTSDFRHNNQPYHFYLYRGRSYGGYARQEIEFNPWWKLWLNLRNELLYIRSRAFFLNNDLGERVFGNDLVRIAFMLRPHPNLEAGVQLSNVLIGQIEGSNPQLGSSDAFSRTRRPMLLEASNFILVDFYLYYRI